MNELNLSHIRRHPFWCFRPAIHSAVDKHENLKEISQMLKIDNNKQIRLRRIHQKHGFPSVKDEER